MFVLVSSFHQETHTSVQGSFGSGSGVYGSGIYTGEAVPMKVGLVTPHLCLHVAFQQGKCTKEGEPVYLILHEDTLEVLN